MEPSTTRGRTFRLPGLSLIVALLMPVAVGSPAFGAPKPLDPIQVRQTLMQRGIGKGVKVVESDGTHVTGILTAIRDDDFELTPQKTITPTKIPYAQVVTLHNDGRSTTGKVFMGIGIGAALYFAVGLVVALIVIGVEAH